MGYLLRTWKEEGPQGRKIQLSTSIYDSTIVGGTAAVMLPNFSFQQVFQGPLGELKTGCGYTTHTLSGEIIPIQ